MLRTPALAAAVLLREERLLEAAFRQKAAYLIYEGADEEESHQPARAPGGVHEGGDRHADLHEPRVPR